MKSVIRECFARPQSSSDTRGLDRCYKKPHTLLVADSWSGQTNRATQELLQRRGIDFLQLPPLTTKYIQPLDVYFNRQYKIFVQRIIEESADPRAGISREHLTSREGIISTHSLIWNQFGSEAYTDMIRYAWHNTDPHWSTDEFTNRPPPRGVLAIQFSLKGTRCEHREHDSNSLCQRPAFIMCSHCGKALCLKHFMERSCFHEVSRERAGPSGASQSHHVSSEYDDDDFDPDIFSRQRSTSTTTTTTTTTTSTTTTTTTTTPRPKYGAPGTYSIDVIEPMWLGPKKYV